MGASSFRLAPRMSSTGAPSTRFKSAIPTPPRLSKQSKPISAVGVSMTPPYTTRFATTSRATAGISWREGTPLDSVQRRAWLRRSISR